MKKKGNRKGEQGQVLLEWVPCLFLTVCVVAAGTRLLRSHWVRAKCIFQVFESTHSHLVGLPVFHAFPRVQVESQADRVVGMMECEEEIFKMELMRLETNRE